MDPFVNHTRCCSECGSRDYVFRGRKKIPADAELRAAVETKYACKVCGHVWKEQCR